MILTLPVPPSVNMMYTNVRGRGRVKTQKYRDWIRTAELELLPQSPFDRIEGPYQVDIMVGKIRGDIDNRIKATVDFLVAMNVVSDDRNMVRVQISKVDGCEGCVVEVRAA